MSASVAAVLGDFDLLQQVLFKLIPEQGCTVEARLRVAQVSRLWREVSRTMPVCLQLTDPLTTKQAAHLKAGNLAKIRHIGFAGIAEDRSHEILEAPLFRESSLASLTSITGMPLKDDLASLNGYSELRVLSLCRGKWATIMDLVRGRRYNLDQLGSCRKLHTLTLRDLAGPHSALDLSKLPSCLKHLHLVNSSFVHHPEMQLPSELLLETLSATSGSRQCTVIPVELLRRTKQAIITGRQVFLSGQPTDYPDMPEDSIEVIISHNTLLLLGYGMAQVQHESHPGSILKSLVNSNLQLLRLSSDSGGSIHLVDRSDCRKGLRWKSLESVNPPNFAQAVSSSGGSTSAFKCNVEEMNPDGSIRTLCLLRAGVSNDLARFAALHERLQKHTKELQEETQIRLDQALDELVWRP